MKLIVTSDLHQRIEKWMDLAKLVENERPRFVLIAGDLLPKEGGYSAQKAFFSELRRYLQRMHKAGPTTVLTYLGNDDYHTLEPRLDALEKEELCINLNGRVHRENGLVFCGMNKVRDYPFGYKHWCAPDGDYIKCPTQFCGEGLTVDEKGECIPLADLAAYLSGKSSLEMELEALKQKVRPKEMARSIWMIHQPPSSLGMDICGHGEQVGSPAVLKFIQKNQPLLGCSGHIHESPYQSKGRWIGRVGRTLWFQPGQMGQRLHAVVLELADALAVTGVRHTIFGAASRMPGADCRLGL